MEVLAVTVTAKGKGQPKRQGDPKWEETAGPQGHQGQHQIRRKQRASILYKIGCGKFDHASHFPDSKRRHQLCSNPDRDRTVNQALDLWLSVKNV
ncbi:MAG: hypothetical protein H6992_04155 [Pseudomonadales bacterium]|nr:hypothetical protein [Pseudomonadales bacterium]